MYARERFVDFLHGQYYFAHNIPTLFLRQLPDRSSSLSAVSVLSASAENIEEYRDDNDDSGDNQLIVLVHAHREDPLLQKGD